LWHKIFGDGSAGLHSQLTYNLNCIHVVDGTYRVKDAGLLWVQPNGQRYISELSNREQISGMINTHSRISVYVAAAKTDTTPVVKMRRVNHKIPTIFNIQRKEGQWMTMPTIKETLMNIEPEEATTVSNRKYSISWETKTAS
jgi:hypothetical protein